MEHILFDGNHSKMNWFTNRLNYCPQVKDQVKVVGWGEGLINSDIGKRKDVLALVKQICWSI